MHPFRVFLLLVLFRSGHAGGTTRNAHSSRKIENHGQQVPQQTPAFVDPENEGEMLQNLKERHLRGDLTFRDLGAKDERQAQAFCSYFLEVIELPEYLECSCSVSFFVNIGFSCSLPVCVDSLAESLLTILDESEFGNIAGAKELASTATSLVTNIIGEPCITPSYSGNLFVPLVQLRSEVCNSPIKMNVTLPNSDEPSLVVDLPEVCAILKHKSVTELLAARDCGFSVGGEECECTVCGDTGRAISLDCSNVTSLGPLSPYFQFECVGFGFVNTPRPSLPGNETETDVEDISTSKLIDSPPINFFNPLTLMGEAAIEHFFGN